MVEFDQNMNISIAGDTFNTCAAASLFGLECEYTMRVAEDIFYQHYLDFFKKFDIQMNLISGEGQNGIYFISNDETGERSFQYYRKNSAASTLSLDMLGSNYLDCDIFYNSGITAALSPELNFALEQCYQKAKEQKIMTVYDVNFREKLWSQEKAKKFLKKIATNIDVLIISEDDFAVVSGLNHPFIVKRQGPKGVSLIREGSEKKFTVKPIQALDTSGAGDVFTGAMLAHYMKKNQWEEAIEFAITIAGKHIQYLGALPRKELLC